MNEVTTNPSANGELPEKLVEQGIVLMEDSERERGLIADEIKKWYANQKIYVPIKYAHNEDEVISFCKEGFQIYIVDIHMGEDRQQEGLNALERLKKMDAHSFVAILSGNLEPFTRTNVLKKADIVQQKTGNRAKDIEAILHRRCERLLRSIKNVLKTETEKVENVLSNSENLDFISISSELERLRSLLSVKVLDEISENIPEHNKEESNFIEYDNLRSDPLWMKKNKGKYVIFAEGELVKVSKDDTPQSGQDLLLWLTQEQDLCNKKRFFTQVTEMENPTRLDEPMSLSFDGFRY